MSEGRPVGAKRHTVTLYFTLWVGYGLMANNELSEVVSWNCLADMYAVEAYYKYTEPWTLSWHYRKHLVISEILSHDADILTLQEVRLSNACIHIFNN